MDVASILERSVFLLKRNFFLLFFIVFIPQVILFVLNTGGLVVMESLEIRPTLGPGSGFDLSTLIAFLVFLIFQFWAQGALIHAVSETYLGHSTSVGTSYGEVRRRLFRLLGTLILAGFLVLLAPALTAVAAAAALPILLAAGVGKLTLGAAGALIGFAILWLTVRLFLNWLLVDKVVILEDKGWTAALRRSRELMSARTEPGFLKRPRNKAALIVALGFFLGVGLSLLFQLPGVGLGFILPGLFAASVSGLLGMVASSLAAVLTATALIIFYYDIRLRKEGFDLKMMAKGLE